MIKALGYAARHSFSSLRPFEFERQEAGPFEVEIEVLYCGVCHSDIHQVQNEWANTVYPCLPGHEVVGRVTRCGTGVTRHRAGDLVGVGCMIDSCRRCEACQSGDQNYCQGPNGFLATYNGPMIPAAQAPDSGNMYGRDNTFGGYSNILVVHQDFVLKIPPQLPPAHAAPLLCAGVTTFSTLRHWGIGSGDRVGILGLGGLGHIAVKLAQAMGAEVTALTSSEKKFTVAEQLGVPVMLGHDADALKRARSSFDFLLSTIPRRHDLNPFLELLKRDSTLCVVGALEPMAPVKNQELAMQRRHVAGSLIGNLAETQAVLDFCAARQISADVEMIGIQEVNEAYHHVVRGEVRFRYVIDMASLAQDSA
ncbi:MAG: NAD(P)-dependent alcohol dehydrogenase [Sinobacteraceae bacterium]|nr:NAD(P)-dependent alcohol dehydrogenase [Nevskiaceae bacterium]